MIRLLGDLLLRSRLRRSYLELRVEEMGIVCFERVVWWVLKGEGKVVDTAAIDDALLRSR